MFIEISDGHMRSNVIGYRDKSARSVNILPYLLVSFGGYVSVSQCCPCVVQSKQATYLI